MAQPQRVAETVSTPDEAVLGAARKGDYAGLQSLLKRGGNPNIVDPKTGATPLHYVAAYAGRPALVVLLRSGQCRFLVRDRQGRLPSEMAGVYGDDPVMARLLMRREKREAAEQGIPIRRREALPPK